MIFLSNRMVPHSFHKRPLRGIQSPSQRPACPFLRRSSRSRRPDPVCLFRITTVLPDSPMTIPLPPCGKHSQGQGSPHGFLTLTLDPTNPLDPNPNPTPTPAPYPFILILALDPTVTLTLTLTLTLTFTLSLSLSLYSLTPSLYQTSNSTLCP